MYEFIGRMSLPRGLWYISSTTYVPVRANKHLQEWHALLKTEPIDVGA
jgi:uncharacterized cysteine cluster protein YcgN (CxxCxxCC family)